MDNVLVIPTPIKKTRDGRYKVKMKPWYRPRPARVLSALPSHHSRKAREISLWKPTIPIICPTWQQAAIAGLTVQVCDPLSLPDPWLICALKALRPPPLAALPKKDTELRKLTMRMSKPVIWHRLRRRVSALYPTFLMPQHGLMKQVRDRAFLAPLVNEVLHAHGMPTLSESVTLPLSILPNIRQRVRIQDARRFVQAYCPRTSKKPSERDTRPPGIRRIAGRWYVQRTVRDTRFLLLDPQNILQAPVANLGGWPSMSQAILALFVFYVLQHPQEPDPRVLRLARRMEVVPYKTVKRLVMEKTARLAVEQNMPLIDVITGLFARHTPQGQRLNVKFSDFFRNFIERLDSKEEF